MKRPAAAAAALLLLSDTATAVPSLQRLLRKHHDVETASCLVCHSRDAGGKLNDYGKDFVRAGGGWSAFAALARKDADGDRARNAEEIRAGSNPGDAASTPRRPGSWLENAPLEARVPLGELGKFFPEAGRFEFVEYTLDEADRDAVQRALGEPVRDEDLYPTLYFAVDASKTPPVRTGVAMFAIATLDSGLLLTGVAVAPAGTVLHAFATRYAPLGRDKLPELAGQFVGKSTDDPLELGKDLTPVKGRPELSLAAAVELKKDLLILTRLLTGG